MADRTVQPMITPYKKNIIHDTLAGCIYMCKDPINAIPTSKGVNSGRDQHVCQSRPSCVPSGPTLGSWPDNRVDTRPRSPLLVSMVYEIAIHYFGLIQCQ